MDDPQHPRRPAASRRAFLTGSAVVAARAVDRAGHRSPATFPFPKPA